MPTVMVVTAVALELPLAVALELALADALGLLLVDELGLLPQPATVSATPVTSNRARVTTVLENALRLRDLFTVYYFLSVT
jgi:hypothetical protein